MKSKENLVFLGMMASGKSSIGLLIAKKLKLDFIDIDKEIEKELGLSISNIFNERGEDYFRKLEEKITLKKLKVSSTVIALGGGAFTNKNIRKEVLKDNISFFGAGKSILLMKKTSPRIIANPIIDLIIKLVILILPELVFLLNCI